MIDKTYQEIVKELHLHNFDVRVVPVEFLNKVKEKYNTHYKDKIIHEDIYKTYLKEFQFNPSELIQDPKTIFLVSTYSPPWEVKFQWNGKEYSTIIPPTYSFGKKTDDKALSILSKNLTPHGFQVKVTIIPKKNLAAHSGLVKYGRNNITYTTEFGSYHRLTAFISDYPCPNENWFELELMEQCKSCSACRNNCPTHAITENRFIVRAERCLTFYNEKEGKIAFPEWIDPSWHNCLVGCMRCQWVCPVNKKVLKKYHSGPTFTEKETREILESNFTNELSKGLMSKLKEIDMENFYEGISRNLKLLLMK